MPRGFAAGRSEHAQQTLANTLRYAEWIRMPPDRDFRDHHPIQREAAMTTAETETRLSRRSGIRRGTGGRPDVIGLGALGIAAVGVAATVLVLLCTPSPAQGPNAAGLADVVAPAPPARDQWYLEDTQLASAPSLANQARDRWYLDGRFAPDVPKDRWYSDPAYRTR
jgi:hypothetical protein